MKISNQIHRILILLILFLLPTFFLSFPSGEKAAESTCITAVQVIAAEHAVEGTPHEAPPIIGDEHPGEHGADNVGLEEDHSAGHTEGHAVESHGDGHGPIKMAIWWIIPFAGMLLSIALVPLINGAWWHHNFSKISLFWGLPMAIAMFIVLQTKTIHVFVEYCSFIALVGSLFVISGGIMIRGDFKSSPLTNCAFLAIGSIIASFIGTAGASMVLIRPMLRLNAKRKMKVHIFVFFIFMVSNIGGSLTPLGDPPLFLGFLQGVPFAWTLLHMLPGWAFMITLLLGLFFLIDTFIVKREGGVKEVKGSDKFEISGGVNFLFLGGVLLTVITYGSFMPREWGFGRDVIQVFSMCFMAALSLLITSKELRKENGFTWFPVKEVAILFAAIFATMIPALNILEYMGTTGQMAVEKPWQFFWMTGILSSFLDNAPTYLTFLALAKTMIPIAADGTCQLAAQGMFSEGIAVVGGCVPQQILLAISMGAVFMGANTYIGNAPNFMVKSICEENDVKMPSFIGYMGWSIAILIPLFVITSFIFFNPAG